MLKISAGFFLFFLAASFFSVSASPVNSKARTQSLFPFKNIHAAVTKDQLNQFERQFTDYFSIKANTIGAPAVSIAAQRPSQADYFMIARYWNFFSPEFRAQYLKSQEIDSAMDHSYVSPGGHFEIYYTMRGTYAVPKADAYGYSASDWHEKSLSPNGVPDYIDEVAWALDSAWSMEVDGFGFVKPISYVDAAHGSNRYKVEVDLADDADYGLTLPMPSGNASGPGSASILQIRNNWTGFGTSSIDYSRHPELAVRVTCVHEFFHAIQYSMTWKENSFNASQFLDDFPVSWLEGTAVLMENIGFDSVNDYLQYVSFYSKNPNSTILNDDPTYVYTTVLLAMFLYERIQNAPTIGFIKEMFFNNYAKPVGFLADLDSTSKRFNTTWPEMFGRFYTESYFMGLRSRPGYFVHDAPLFDAWPLNADSLDIAYSIRKIVPAYGMQTFSITKKNYPFDNLSMGFFGDTLAPAVIPTFWSMHLLSLKSDASRDSIFSVPISLRSRAGVAISGWSAFDTAIFIVANSQGVFDKKAAFVFGDTVVPTDSQHADSIIVFPNPVHIRGGAVITVNGIGVRLLELLLYNVTGTLVYRAQTNPPAARMQWNLTNARGKTVAPGAYYAVIGFEDPVTKGMKKLKQKVLVVP
jgi:hypothetical protein